MSPRTRIWLIVGAAAVIAAAGTVGVVALTRDHPAKKAKAAAKPPLLFLDLGVRDDAEARALRHAGLLYERGGFAAARSIFERYTSLEAKVGAAMASGPNALERLKALPQRKSAVRLHEAVVLALAGDRKTARNDLVAATRLEPDTGYAVRADDFLHPKTVPGLPFFIVSRPYPARLAHLKPTAQLAALARMKGVEGRLRYGSALLRLRRPISARRVFDQAVRLAPNDPEALTAAAVGRFDKDAPVKAFARLGPLTRRFPRSQTVRFHLGILLLWLGNVPDAKKQFRQSLKLGPVSLLGKEARRFLARL